MLDEAAPLYSLTELKELQDVELLSLLRTAWQFPDNKPIEVIGRLKKISTNTGSTFFVIESIRSSLDGASLNYPVKMDENLQTIFVGSFKGANLDSSIKEGEWVKTKVELSPAVERAKRENPFALKVVDGSITRLKKIPAEIADKYFDIDGKVHIESWLVDYYRDKNSDKIFKEGSTINDTLIKTRQEEEHKIKKMEGTVDALVEKLASSKNSLEETKTELSDLKKKKSKDHKAYLRQQIELEQKLNKLTEYVAQKLSILVDLDLVSQSEADSMVGDITTLAPREGHDFLNTFEGSESKTVSYIQAYMRSKNIMYRRSVLEDFYALITMHDLIVLAGDSGSGKTNLVKSFADAVGGKSIIIPVKPNWTSAEDLLGYYNPLEQKYLTTPFLDAIFEAKRNPNIPYFICLDEMNLARVEYYFADFLSLLEERNTAPEIMLYSDTESDDLVSETKNFLALIDEAKLKLNKVDLVSFLDLMRDEEINSKLHELCGFREGDSLLKYHSRLRKMLKSYLNIPAKLALPDNVRIIGAINVDETTHYLSPKILDRVHLMRFSSPLLTDWDAVDAEIETFDLDMSLPVQMESSQLGVRSPYPEFDRNDGLVGRLIKLATQYLEPLGVEFGMRAVRQARHYSNAIQPFGVSDDVILNNIVLHKVLPKLLFDGERPVTKELLRRDILVTLRDFLTTELSDVSLSAGPSCIDELDRVIRNAENNDWVVNYWAR